MKRSGFKPSKPKAKRCPICREMYVKTRAIQPTCQEIACAVEFSLANIEKVKAKEAKARRKDTKVALEKIKTLPQLKKEAQIAFNRYIRERDARRGLPCICCGKPFMNGALTGGEVDAGHYRSIGSAPHLRFHEDNCHAQAKQCNRHGAGRAVDYRLGLIARIGLEAVEALEADNTPRHYAKDELRALAALYRAKLKELKK